MARAHSLSGYRFRRLRVEDPNLCAQQTKLFPSFAQRDQTAVAEWAWELKCDCNCNSIALEIAIGNGATDGTESVHLLRLGRRLYRCPQSPTNRHYMALHYHHGVVWCGVVWHASLVAHWSPTNKLVTVDFIMQFAFRNHSRASRWGCRYYYFFLHLLLCILLQDGLLSLLWLLSLLLANIDQYFCLLLLAVLVYWLCKCFAKALA